MPYCTRSVYVDHGTGHFAGLGPRTATLTGVESFSGLNLTIADGIGKLSYLFQCNAPLWTEMRGNTVFIDCKTKVLSSIQTSLQRSCVTDIELDTSIIFNSTQRIARQRNFVAVLQCRSWCRNGNSSTATQGNADAVEYERSSASFILSFVHTPLKLSFVHTQLRSYSTASALSWVCFSLIDLHGGKYFFQIWGM